MEKIEFFNFTKKEIISIDFDSTLYDIFNIHNEYKNWDLKNDIIFDSRKIPQNEYSNKIILTEKNIEESRYWKDLKKCEYITIKSPKELKIFLLNILQNLDYIPQDYKNNKYFVSIYDEPKTDFEILSSELNIAVIAKSKIEGQVLLFFLRMIIDDSFELAIDKLLEDMDEDLCPNVFEIIDMYKNYETGNILDVNQKIIHNNIYKYPYEMELWDRKEIKKFISNL